MGSMFLISLQKTPGTDIEDDRDSTSYSGAEYSLIPTENMYGKDMLVRQSVWYYIEYDMLLGKKSCDVMVLYALDDNIISSEFTDEDE